jgi:hypothetical protein
MRIIAGIACGVALFAAAANVYGLDGMRADDAPPELTVAQWKASPPVAGIVRITGYVVDTYLCPPCPMGMECKPCMSHTSITIADAPIHIQGAPAIVIAVPDLAPFEHGTQYRFEITAGPDDGLDGRLLRSQRGDEPPWTTPG